jgi:ABC-type branched-subunit amino acid transport system substrate-binding protein
VGRAEALRLTAAVALAAGAVVLGESLLGGNHRSGSKGGSLQQTLAGPPAAAGSAPSSTSGGPDPQSGGSAPRAARVVVAGGPAVTRSLKHGALTVVVDQPSSGMFTEQNRSIAQGAELAAAEVSASGGLPHRLHIKLVRQTLDGLSASALKSRLASEGAAVLVLPCDTDSQQALAAAASQYGMLMLAPCNADATAGARHPTYWPVGMSATEEAAGLASFMSTVGYGSVFTVSAPGSSYVELLTNDFRSAAQKKGIKLVGSASIATTTQDFSPLAHTIEASEPRPSAIFTALPPPLVNRMAAGLLAQGVDQTVLGSTAMDTPLTLSSGSRALENAVFPSYGFPRVSASAHRLETAYHKHFGHNPVGSFPGLGFETIRLLERAVGKARSGEPSAIQQALASGIALSGVALAERAYQAGGDHNPIGPVAISKVAAGSFLPLLATTPSGVSTP